MLYSFDSTFKWIGSPKPHIQRFRLAAGIFLFGLRHTLLTAQQPKMGAIAIQAKKEQ